MLKKTLTGIIVFASIVMLSVRAVLAEETLTKTVYANVAQFKSITSTYPGNVERLVDGNEKFGTDYQYSFGSSGATVTVDLGHRYKIKAIEMLHVDGGNGTVYVANQSDGSDKVSVGSLAWSKSFNAELDGTVPYRYVIIKGGAWATYRELKVYAEQTVTEVSRNKPAEANKETVYGSVVFGASKAVNGTNLDNTDAWVAEGATADAPCHYLAVNLERPYHIGYIEMQGRNGADQLNYRQDIGIYGANTLTDENKQAYLTTEKITDTSVANRLAWIGETYQYPTDAFPFPAYDASDPEGTTYKTTVNDSEAYQYIVYKKESVKWMLPAAVGSFKAYVVNPQIFECAYENNSIRIEFSDEMDYDSLSNVRLISRNTGETVACTVSQESEYVYNIQPDVEMFNDVLTLDLSGVTNTLGTEVYTAETIEFETPSAIDVESFDIINDIDGSGEIVGTIADAQKLGAKVIFKNNMPAVSDVATAVVVTALLTATIHLLRQRRYGTLHLHPLITLHYTPVLIFRDMKALTDTHSRCMYGTVLKI